MAKKKPAQYEDALGSIYDFIFSHPNKRAGRRPPIRYNNKDASKQMAQALAEISMSPASMITSAGLDGVNMWGGQELARFYIDKKDPDDESGRIRVRVGDIGKWLKNPDKYIDDIYAAAKQARKAPLYKHVGRGMDQALAFLWAARASQQTKMGLKLGDAWDFGSLGAERANPYMTSKAEHKIMETAAMEVLGTTRNSPAAARDVLKLLESEPRIFKGSGGQKRLERLLSRSSVSAVRSDATKIAAEIMAKYQGNFVGTKKTGETFPLLGYWNAGGDTDRLNRIGYSQIWRKNLTERMRIVDPSDPNANGQLAAMMGMHQALSGMDRIWGMETLAGDDAIMPTLSKMQERIDFVKKMGSPGVQKSLVPELEKIYKEMQEEGRRIARRQSSVSYWRAFGNPYRMAGNDMRKAVAKSLDFDLQILRSSLLETTDPVRQREINSLISNYLLERASVQRAPMGEIQFMFGDIAGALESVDAYVVKGGLAKALFDGSFYGDGGFLSPARKLKGINFRFRYGAVDAKTKQNRVGFNDLIIPRSDINPGIATLAAFNYFTPASLFRTFFYNGEGFAYLGYMNRKRLGNMLARPAFANIIESDPTLAKEFAGMFDPNSGLLSADAVVDNFDEVIKLLKQHHSKFKGLPSEIIDAFEKFDKRLGNIFGIFNSPARTFGLIGKTIDKYTMLYVRKAIGWVATKLGAEAKVVADFIEKQLGLRQLITSAVKAILATLGASTSGPLGALVANLISWIATDLLMKMSKPFVKIAQAIIFILVGSAVAWVMIMFLGMLSVFESYDSYTPGSAIAGSPDNMLLDDYDDLSTGDIDYANAPDDATCPIIYEDPLWCTWGSTGAVSNYHLTYKAMDVRTRGFAEAVWYAPSDGDVIESSTTNYNCLDGSNTGGMVKFQDDSGNVYVLIHVIPIAEGRVRAHEPVAAVQRDIPGVSSYCWTAEHFHLHTYSGGNIVDTPSWYRDVLKCNITGSC